MTEQQVDKFIRDMRSGLIFVSVLQVIGAFLLQDTVMTIVTAVIVILFYFNFFRIR